MPTTDRGTSEREDGSLLRPAAWYVDEMDARTLDRVAGLVRAAFA